MRLITRSDFDGLVCAVLLEAVGKVDGEYKFVHPKDVQDGKVEVAGNDVLANVPYAAGCGLWFDHHSSETERLADREALTFEGDSRPALSCARIIYDYFGGAEKFSKFDQKGLMAAADKVDSADFDKEDILEPEGWVLVAFIMDPRTGLGRCRDYRIGSLDLMRDMIKYCRDLEVEEILEVPDVQERVKRYFEQEASFEGMMRRNCITDRNVIAIDLRSVEPFLSGNRFIEYAIYPYQNVSVRAIWGKEKQNVVITVGHSIIDRTCNTDVGKLMLRYGGGGHRTVGTCQVAAADADRVFKEIVSELKKNG